MRAQQREEWVKMDDQYITYSLFYNPDNITFEFIVDIIHTCVVASVHVPVVVAHSVQVIQVVIWISSQAIWPSPWRPMGR